MIRSELAVKLAERYKLPVKDTNKLIAAVLDAVTQALISGRRVELRGFGSFAVKYRSARPGRNPRTGEAVEIGQKRWPFFRSSKEMRHRMNIIDSATSPEGYK